MDNIYLGKLPKRIIMGMLAQGALTGLLRQNPFNFQHFGITHCQLYVNNVPIPARPFQPNFTTGHYIREYDALVKVLDVDNSGRELAIDRADYGNGYTLFAWDLTPDGDPRSASIGPPLTGVVRLDMRFAAALTETVNVILYSEYGSEIKIDKFRNVTLEEFP